MFGGKGFPPYRSPGNTNLHTATCWFATPYGEASSISNAMTYSIYGVNTEFEILAYGPSPSPPPPSPPPLPSPPPHIGPYLEWVPGAVGAANPVFVTPPAEGVVEQLVCQAVRNLLPAVSNAPLLLP